MNKTLYYKIVGGLLIGLLLILFLLPDASPEVRIYHCDLTSGTYPQYVDIVFDQKHIISIDDTGRVYTAEEIESFEQSAIDNYNTEDFFVIMQNTLDEMLDRGLTCTIKEKDQ